MTSRINHCKLPATRCLTWRSLQLQSHWRKWTPARSFSQVGLYGVAGLKPSAAALADFKESAIARTEALREKVAGKGKVASGSTLRQLDDISFTLCVGLDALELCRSTHTSAEARFGR